MLRKLLKSKIHRATVTFTDVNYPGSITIDRELIAAAGLLVNEAVVIADCENGNRFETYVIPGEAGSGTIGINGAAARLTSVGNKVIVLAYVLLEEQELEAHASTVVVADDANGVKQIIQHKTLADD
ncbi:MAG: aspartate 1-decarboxylase [Phycisphaerae bacterium]